MGIRTKENESLNEKEIIARVLRGERDEFRHLVLAYSDQVYAMIMRQVGDEETARELAQDAFVKAYMNLAKFQFRASFSTWITRIAINLSHSYFRSRRYKQSKATSSLEQVHHQNLSDENNNSREEDARRLQSLIGTLKPKYREVLVLCCFEDYTYEQAARLLHIPYGTVCSRMNKAFSILRERF